jgi:tRNA modification GTPase
VILDDTIIAISSGVGSAGRMVVRASGPEVWRIARGVGCELTGGEGGGARAGRREMNLGAGISFGVWVWEFRSPGSYTGQDLVEFHIPGNPLLARMVMGRAIELGARGAEAGEFTARAYFNRKLDLAQAEGVAATIEAGSRGELSAARQLMAGELSRRLRPVMDLLTQTLALVEVGIDFSEEDVEFLSRQDIEGRLRNIGAQLENLVRESSRFEKLSHEPTVVLCGRANAGKSTLANALAGRNRSVVSATAGTTRDALSVEIFLPRGKVWLLDVAGLKEGSPGDSISRQMREQAEIAMERADLVVLVREAGDERPPAALPRGADMVVWSKCDLGKESQPEGISVSALTGFNMDRLRHELDRLAFGAESVGAQLALGARHLAAIEQAQGALVRAGERMGSAELLAADLREALDALGQILGMVTPDDLLGRIFSTFCIGK